MDLTCFECHIDGPINPGELHDGELLCTSCAKRCTCTPLVLDSEFTETEESPMKLMIRREGRAVDEVAVEPAGDNWRLTEHAHVLALVPGDVVSADIQGFITGVVESVPDVYTIQAHFSLESDVGQIAAKVAEWGRATAADLDTPYNANVSSTSREWLRDMVERDPLVQVTNMRRAPATDVRLDVLFDQEWPS